TITDKNISGTLKSDFGIQFIYDYDSGVDAESVLFDGAINIKNGNLKNIESLRSVARFTGENDLQNIYFSEISNTLNIKHRIITVPLMRIESDAADFDFKGAHTFDNYIDYRVNIELSDMLSKNFKKRKSKDAEFGNIVEEQKERIRLPLHIYGFMGNLTVKYDFKQSTKNFKEKIKVEKEKTKEILKQEFLRSPQHQQNRQEKQQWKEQEKGKFVFEKEDDATKSEEISKTDKTPKTGENSKTQETKKQDKTVNQFLIEEDD
ncbi:MAG: AsmA-like C-terminal region-containing protein, partial [Bacteroidales bacterium]|nr:AsmA-like C-terminal region-containing protein [Bacteroidales bacterium]